MGRGGEEDKANDAVVKGRIVVGVLIEEVVVSDVSDVLTILLPLTLSLVLAETTTIPINKMIKEIFMNNNSSNDNNNKN